MWSWNNCYIVTEELKKSLVQSRFTGFEFMEMEVTKAECFNENYQLKKNLPKFFWLKITGEKGIDDLYISENDCLMTDFQLTKLISDKFNHTNLDIDKEEDKEQHDLLRRLLERAKRRNG